MSTSGRYIGTSMTGYAMASRNSSATISAKRSGSEMPSEHAARDGEVGVDARDDVGGDGGDVELLARRLEGGALRSVAQAGGVGESRS